MRFKIPNNQVKEIITAANIDLQGRFSVFNVDNRNHIEDINKLLTKVKGEKFNKFINNVSQRPYARTNVYLGYDEYLKRQVIIKTSKYRDNDGFIVCDYDSEKNIRERRSMIHAQINILNDIKSPLLPEPIDFFYVENNNPKIPARLRKEEPVLVLDYQSGKTVAEYIYGLANKENDIRINTKVDEFAEIKEVREKLRIVKSIIIFLKELEKKNYAYQSLNPKNIILLRDKTPRLLGLGTICKTKNGILDRNHINYGVCELGFSAPELNNPNCNPKKITSSGVGAFSIGVLIHQLIGEFTSIDLDQGILGEYGQLKYPNGETEKIIKSSPLKPRLVHNLIYKLCKEDVDERLTDYDEILKYIEEIIGGKKAEPKRNTSKETMNYEVLADKVLITDSSTEIKHCEDDHSILEEKILGINVYCESKRESITRINKKGYVCNICKTAYIDDEVHEEIINELEELHEEETKANLYDLQRNVDGELEKIFIKHRNNIKKCVEVRKLIKTDTNISTCAYKNHPLEEKDVFIGYYSKEENEKYATGKLKTKLLVCQDSKCATSYIDEKQLIELEKLLPDSNKYEFDYKNYKDEFKIIKSINRLDNVNHCPYDLETLTQKDVLVDYYSKYNKNNNQLGNISTKLSYCPKCNRYYIRKDAEENLKKLLPEDGEFKINRSYRICSSLIKADDNKTMCSFDRNKLEREKVIVLSKHRRYQIYANILRCKKCNKTYITQKEINRIKEILPKGYKNLELKNEFLFKVDKIVEIQNDELDLCMIDKNKIKYGNISIACYDRNTGNIADYINKRVRYCDECKKVYLNQHEIKEIKDIIGNNYIMFDSLNHFKIKINNALGYIKSCIK